MNLDQEQLSEIADQIGAIIKNIHTHEEKKAKLLTGVCGAYKASAKNLLHYSAFRGQDLRRIQKKLKRLGLSRFANAEGNIMGSLQNAMELLHRLNGGDGDMEPYDALPIGAGKKHLRKNTAALFGKKRNGRRVKIMVTQPTQAAQNYQLVLEMVKNGMDCARINCAHDHPEVWNAIVEHVRRAAEECNTSVSIAMDLAGPKIRTGSLGEGPRVQKFRPKRNALGVVEAPAHIWLVPDNGNVPLSGAIPVPGDWLAQLEIGDKLSVQDTRGKTRKLVVRQVGENKALIHCQKTVYLGTDTWLVPKGSQKEKITIGEIPMVEKAIELHTGDILVVTGDEKQGSPAEFDENGNLLEPASIACLPGSIIQKAKVGEPILFDDGKIEGTITEVHKGHFKVKIVKARENGSQLKAEKGINFPTLDLGLSGLTAKDREDLKFVAQHADMVNFSFVNNRKDVEELVDALEELGARDKVSIILKIETRFAYRNLVSILLEAMKTKYVGVMIARGDLALEVGWKNMAKVQEEILSLCSAAHVPVIWATQVLEGLAKKGLPSRSEITDIASSLKAECVMLNKGPYINEAIALLSEFLGNMEKLHDKKEGMWPKIEAI